MLLYVEVAAAYATQQVGTHETEKRENTTEREIERKARYRERERDVLFCLPPPCLLVYVEVAAAYPTQQVGRIDQQKRKYHRERDRERDEIQREKRTY